MKGPTAKLMGELGIALVNASIAAHYGAFLDGLVIDSADDAPAGLAVARTATLMRDDADKAPLLAARAMAFIGRVFAIDAEARAKELRDAELLAWRQARAGPWGRAAGG